MRALAGRACPESVEGMPALRRQSPLDEPGPAVQQSRLVKLSGALLTGNWRALLPSPWGVIALSMIAIVCGAVVGAERQKREKPAGLRTLILVCLGSAVFTTASFIFTSDTGDSGRVAAQIVTGIGFLGAGVILHGRGTISGTTTAATIWVMAAIGMLAGAGYAGGAMGLSVLVRLVLTGIFLYEKHIAGEQQAILLDLDFAPMNGITRVRLERVLADNLVGAGMADWKTLHEDHHRLTLRLHLQRRHLRELLDELVSVPEVKSVHESQP